MNAITIPDSLLSTFVGTEPTHVCDEAGKILGYYTPLREGSDEDYEWAMKQMTPELVEASLNSGLGRPLAVVLAELREKYGP